MDIGGNFIMKTIVIGFSTPNTWKPFSWLIQTSLNIPYDHVYIKVHSDEFQCDMIYQASSTMVNFMGTDIFSANNNTLDEFSISMSDTGYTAMMQWAAKTAGTPYSIKEIIGLAIVRIAELCGKTIKNPLRDGNSAYVCSELVSYILREYADLKIPKDYEDMTPLDVHTYLLSIKAQ
jgi:hypothetical protein